MAKPVVVDVETQMSFREVGGFDPRKLKISVAGIYDYATNDFRAFTEPELPQLFPLLENASVIVGFNLIDFDFPVLNPYYVGDLKKFPTLDLLKEVEKNLGFRISLDDLARETLNAKKSGHGLLAIEYFKSGEIEKLKDYCLHDVELTKNLYEFGKSHHKVFYNTAKGKRAIPVDWGQIETLSSSSINLTLPL
jgi:DEAD/DEAH box helicase domain-containing protein